MCRLGIRPTTESVLYREQRHLGKVRIALRPRARAVELALRDGLRLVRVEELEVRLRDGARAAALHDFVDDGHGRSGDDAPRGDDLFELVFLFARRQERLVLPRDQDVADPALDEGGRRAARA